MARLVVAALAPGACSALVDASGLAGVAADASTDGVAGANDGSAESGAGSDALETVDVTSIEGGPRSGCRDDAPFGVVHVLTELNSPSKEGQPRLSADELTIYFQRQMPSGTFDLYVAQRDSRDASFDAPQPLAINGAADDLSPSVTADGLYLYFASNRGSDAGVLSMYVASRFSELEPFDATAPVPWDAAPGSIGTPLVLPDRSALYFSMNVTGDGGWRVFRAPLKSGVPQAVGELSELGPASAAVLPADELSIYFSQPAAATERLAVATRADASATFGAPTPLDGGAGSTATDRPGWISADRCRLYFARNVSGDTELVWVERAP